MTVSDPAEAAALLVRLVGVLRTTPTGADQAAGATFKRLADDLSDAAAEKVAAWSFGAEVLAVCRAATAAGATLLTMNKVAVAAATSAPVRPSAVALAQLFLRCAIAQQSRILADTTFRSRDAIDAAIAIINAGFEPAEEYAADHSEPDAYRAFVRLRGSTVRDLVQRGRPLPRMTQFALPVSLPSVVLAKRLYGDASRADELVAENRVVHPLFCPRQGRALGA